MIEAIVTVVMPESVSQTRDGKPTLEPMHTKIYRFEFDTLEALQGWLDEEEAGHCHREQLAAM